MPARRAVLQLLVLPIAVALAGSMAPPTATAATAELADGRADVAAPPSPPRTTAQAIRAAAAAGHLTPAEELRQLALSVTAPDEVRSDLRGAVPGSATTVLTEVLDRATRLPAGPLRDELLGLVRAPTRVPSAGSGAEGVANGPPVPPAPDGRGTCSDSAEPLPYAVQTPHFFVEHGGSFPPGLTLKDYTDALERAYDVHVRQFGFPAPPVTPIPPPAGKYHVRITDIGPSYYGFVSALGTYAGNVGDNPNTPWDEGDAFASCMVLSSTTFEEYHWARFSAKDYLVDAVMHEVHHAIQMGLGIVFAPRAGAPYRRAVDDNVTEGMAMWSEKEAPGSPGTSSAWVWPLLEASMGQPAAYDVYSYFTVWRSFTERYGTAVPGGAEQLVQDYYEGLSQNRWDQLDGLDAVLRARGRTLADAFHEQAVAAVFSAQCGGQYRVPYCWQEGATYASDGYVEAEYAVPLAVGRLAAFLMPDDYSRRFFALPAARRMEIEVSNRGTGGRIRASIACDTGRSISVRTAADLLAGQTTTITTGDRNCAKPSILVLTNLAQSAPNPTTSPRRLVEVRVVPPKRATEDAPFYAYEASLSADGQRVAFITSASLVPEDTNTTRDVYVRDLRSGETVLVSVADDERPSDGSSFSPSISADGNRVAFESNARSLKPQPPPAVSGSSLEVYVRDLAQGTTTLISPVHDVAIGGTSQPSLSDDGRRVAFVSSEIPGESSDDAAVFVGVYVRDVAGGPYTRLDRGSPLASATSDYVADVDLDAAGTTAAFTTSAALVAADENRTTDVYRTTVGGTAELVSRTPSGRASLSNSHSPSIDSSGRTIAFASFGRDLGPADDNFVSDVYVSTPSGMVLASPHAAQRSAGNSFRPAVSANGLVVLFNSFAADLVPNDTNSTVDVFVRALTAGATRRVSTGPAGEQLVAPTTHDGLSHDGGTIALSTAAVLTDADKDEATDLYLRSLVDGSTVLIG